MLLRGEELGAHCFDVEAVVQRFDVLRRPIGQMPPDVLAYGIRYAEQSQTSAEKVGKPAALWAVVVAESVMYADHRESCGKASDVDRLETVRDDHREIPAGGDLPGSTNGAELQSANCLAGVVEEDDFV